MARTSYWPWKQNSPFEAPSAVEVIFIITVYINGHMQEPIDKVQASSYGF